ncbi:MAG: DUF5017 domain-containing protein [Pedobacter sp.]|nr:MAG: DUF5017 domain-containing protein [Pedobacter sp.]
MKNTNHISILFILFTTALLSCKRDEISLPEFSVRTDQNTYKAGEEVLFHFTGDADNIVFWSGEKGNQYANRQRDAEKGTPYVRFITGAGIGAQNDNLSVLVSKNFNGNYDAAGIAAATWTNITATNVTLPTTNLALGRTYTASTVINANSTPDRAFDRNAGTVWQGVGMANQWIAINFGESTTFNQVILKETAIRTTAYRIEYSSDGSNWQTAITGANVGVQNIVNFPAVTASHMRVFYISGSSNANLNELEVYNNPSLAKKALLSTLSTATVAGANTPTVVDLSDFASSDNTPVYVAFKYLSAANALKPRPWTVSAFSVTNTLADGTVNDVVSSFANAGFKGVNIQNASHVWTLAPNITIPTSITVTAGEAGEAVNEDWAISAAIPLNKVSLADKGVPVISITTLSPPTVYKYIFTSPGTYNIVFHAFNQNIKDKKSVIKELTLTITP